MSTGGTFGGQFGGAGVPGLGAPPASGRFGNSPTSNALRNLINIWRLLPTQDGDGAVEGDQWTQIFANVPCSAQVYTVDREDRHGGIRQITEYRFMIGVNPGVLVGDRIDWSDDLGILRKLSVIGQQNLAGRGCAWYLYAEEVI